MSYEQRNQNPFDWTTLPILRCYICNNLLDEKPTKDHIIPQALFPAGSEHRPALPVHVACNSGKSKDDEWFTRLVQARAHKHPDAEKSIIDFLDKADKQWPTQWEEVGTHKIRDYKLATTLFGDATPIGPEDLPNGIVPKLRFGETTNKREAEYIKRLARGLCIRQMPFSNPEVHDLVISQYAGLQEDGLWDDFLKDIGNFFLEPQDATFMQMWPDRVMYVINPSNGMVFIEFWKEVAYTVMLSG